MNRIFFYMLAAVVLTTACDKEKSIPKMTMTTQKVGGLTIILAGSGKVTIDWGDGSKKEEHTLSEFYTTWTSEHRFSHSYASGLVRTISITGENVTHLSCFDIGLTSLEIGQNVALTHLYCSRNQLSSLNVISNIALTTLYCYDNQIGNLDVSRNSKLKTLYCGPNKLKILDVSKNSELEVLYCGSNQFTSLDVSKNSNLNTLICDGNQINNLNVKGLTKLKNLNCGRYTYTPEGLGNHLTSLDVSGCTSLSTLNCENNLLTIESLNVLFGTLHENTISSGKDIFISHNPGAEGCDKSIAENKGWWVAIRSE